MAACQKLYIKKLIQGHRRDPGQRFLIMKHIGIDESALSRIKRKGMIARIHPHSALHHPHKLHIRMPVPGNKTAWLARHLITVKHMRKPCHRMCHIFSQIIIQSQPEYHYIANLSLFLAV